MDLSLKPCTTTTTTAAAIIDVRNRSDSLLVDRLTSLPDDLLIRILSLLPTKYAAATCVLSRRLSRILPWITSLDLDDLPISHCRGLPTRYECFPTFMSFVDTILQAHQSQYLSRFRLAVDPNLYRGSYPVNEWISFPLTRRGLRELDLHVHMREPGDFQLPPAIFTCETLEVLKLDVNIRIDQVSSMPSVRLPILKLLHLRVGLKIRDPGFVGFVTRLVSSCPLLEDFTGEALIDHVRSISISSPSLRRLRIRIVNVKVNNMDFVSIHTPNLEYLDYAGNSALQCSITNMDCLGKADISIIDYLPDEGPEVSCQRMLSFIRPLSKVHCLSLSEMFMRILNRVEVKDQLPVFCNLKHLELGCTGNNYWYKVLLAFLNCSPILETFVFPQGMVADKIEMEEVELEREFCRTALPIIPWCCRFHLKRIVIKNCFGKQREIDLIHFLLRHALVLEELVIFRSMHFYYPSADQKALHSTLQNLPRASRTCTIQVQ